MEREGLMPVRLLDSLATTEPLAEIFSDRSILGAMLEFEVALARVEARLQIIPQAAAEVIASAANPDAFDLDSLSRTIQPAVAASGHQCLACPAAHVAGSDATAET